MPNILSSLLSVAVVGVLVVATGCGSSNTPQADNTTPAAQSHSAEDSADEIAAERAKLSPEDRALIEAQEWCVISTGERLGAMGPPLKLSIKGQPVFICCKGCKRKAEADPDKTLAKLEELKARAKAERDAKN